VKTPPLGSHRHANSALLLLRADDVPLDVIAELGRNVVERSVRSGRPGAGGTSLPRPPARPCPTGSPPRGSRSNRRDGRRCRRSRLTATDPARARDRALPSSAGLMTAAGSGRSPRRCTRQKNILAAEDRLLERARTMTAPTVPSRSIEKVTRRPDRDGTNPRRRPGRSAHRRSRLGPRSRCAGRPRWRREDDRDACTAHGVGA
jgi:hypothetical protein